MISDKNIPLNTAETIQKIRNSFYSRYNSTFKENAEIFQVKPTFITPKGVISR